MARSGGDHGVASHQDIRRMLGDVDEETVIAVVELHPSVGDIEEAVMWLSGDRDVFAPSTSLQGVPAQIVEILTADEEDESGKRS